MPNSDLLPSLLFKINENQLALEAAIMALTLWIEQRGAAEVGGNVRGALEAIDNSKSLLLTFFLVPTAANGAEIGHMSCIFTDFSQVKIAETNRERITQSVEIADSKTTPATLALDGSMRAVNGIHWVRMPPSPLTDVRPLSFFSDAGEILTLLKFGKHLGPGAILQKGVYSSTLITAVTYEHEAYVRFGRCEVQ
jgi:hypothetical protein